MDPEGGLANTVTSLAGDGEWSTEMAPKIDTYIPKETIAQMVIPFGLDATAR